jgi:hypothetical protein
MVKSSTAATVEEETFSMAKLTEEATLLPGVNKEETTALW